MRKDPWGRQLAGPKSPPEAWLTADETENGSDLVQLRDNLARSPEERLRRATRSARGALARQGGAWPTGLKRPDAWPSRGNRREPLDSPFPQTEAEHAGP